MMKHLLNSSPLLNTEGTSTAAPAAPVAAPATIETAIQQMVAARTATAPPATPEVPVVAPVSEAPAVKVEPTTDKLAPKFAALTKKEKELSQRETQLKAREAALLDPRALAKTDPVKAMEMIGLTYEEATDHILAKHRNPTTDDRTAALEKKLLDMETRAKMDTEAARVAEAAQVKEDTIQFIQETITQQGDKYELINNTQNTQLVYDVIEQYFLANGTMLSIADACDHTEKYLDDQLTKTLSWKKVQARMTPQAPSAPPAVAPETGTPTKKVTLTENMGVAPRVSTDNSGHKQLPRDQEIDAALKLLKFTSRG